MTAARATSTQWLSICHFDRLPRERGVAALVDDRQIAIFRTFDDEIYAIGNEDPFTGACVLARGIVGTRGDVPTVASPLHKQVFDLRTGVCLDATDVSVPTFPVRMRDGFVEIGRDEQ